MLSSVSLSAPPAFDFPADERELFVKLRTLIEQAGCFRPAPFSYAIRIIAVSAAISAGYCGLVSDTGIWGRIGCAVLVAFATVQAGFVAHDVGDGSVTANRRIAFCLRHGLMSFGSALSSSYFNYLHKVHHLVMARGGRGLGGEEYVCNPYEIGWFKRAASANGLLFLLATVCLRGLTFKLESLRYILASPKKTRTDAVLVAAHYMLWLLVPALLLGVGEAFVNYLMVTLFAGPYVGTILILNHEGMSKAHRLSGMAMIERVTRTTRDLEGSHIASILYGGVNNHIEHHLFPQIPSIRLPLARRITRSFCEEHAIPYQQTGFLAALGAAIRHFREQDPERLALDALS